MRFNIFAACAFISAMSASVATATSEIRNDTAITFDFQNKQIQFFGIYSPGKSSPRAQGLEAEIAARRNGIAHLNAQLMRGCEAGQSNKPNESVGPSWQGAVKSQGSEIYANGVLKISLIAPMRDVLTTSGKKSLTLKTKDGTPLALKFPRLTASSFKCGVLTLSLAGRTLPLNPLSGSNEIGAKVVNLALDGASKVRPAGSADLALLENSNLFGAVGSSSDGASNTDTPLSPVDNAGSTNEPSDSPASGVQQNLPAN